LAGAALGSIAQNGGWIFVFVTMSAFHIVPFSLFFFIHEPPHKKRYSLKDLKLMLGKKYILVGILGAIVFCGLYGCIQILNPYLSQRFGFNYLIIGFITAVFGAGQILGGILANVGMYYFSVWKVVLTAIILSSSCGMLLAAITTEAAAWPLVLLFGIGAGTLQASFYASVMRFCEERLASTMFAVNSSAISVGIAIGFLITGNISDSLGLQYTFLVSGAIGFLGIPLLYPIFGPISVDLKDLEPQQVNIKVETENLPQNDQLNAEKPATAVDDSSNGHVALDSPRTSTYSFSN